MPRDLSIAVTFVLSVFKVQNILQLQKSTKPEEIIIIGTHAKLGRV